jgi:PHD/YefM family antitoxin component YafN of YafNO toxin-antitoxin module
MAKAQYIVDEKGRKKAVLLSIKEYKSLIARIEDLEDAIELDKAVRDAKSFKEHNEFMKELGDEGLI